MGENAAVVLMVRLALLAVASATSVGLDSTIYKDNAGQRVDS
jgi:hypothetical protein